MSLLEYIKVKILYHCEVIGSIIKTKKKLELFSENGNLQNKAICRIFIFRTKLFSKIFSLSVPLFSSKTWINISGDWLLNDGNTDLK